MVRLGRDCVVVFSVAVVGAVGVLIACIGSGGVRKPSSVRRSLFL